MSDRGDAAADLLRFLDVRLNDLMVRLFRTRETLTDIQRRAGANAALLGQVGIALSTLRESERVLADIQRRLDDMRLPNP